MKRQRFSKFIVAIIVALNAAFTIAVLYIFYKVGSEPVALIAAWFGFTTGELWLLSSIKKEKVRKGETNEDMYRSGAWRHGSGSSGEWFSGKDNQSASQSEAPGPAEALCYYKHDQGE